MQEEWRPTTFYPEIYEVSNFGRVRNKRTGHIKVAQRKISNGRLACLAVQLNDTHTQKLCKVHRLVLLAFVGPCPHGMEGCHNDGNAANNVLSNLRWDTPVANQADRAKHGTSNHGERCAAHKLTEAQVRAIRADNRLQAVIAQDYGVMQNTISRIKAGKRWAHIQ